MLTSVRELSAPLSCVQLAVSEVNYPPKTRFLAPSENCAKRSSALRSAMLSLAALTPLAYHLAGPKPTQGRANAVKMAAAVDTSAC